MASSVDRDDLPNEDTLFEIMSNKRRRYAIYILKNEGVMNMSDLAEETASLELNKPVGQLSSIERKTVYVSLYQTHLTKLEDADLIEFDRNTGVIEASNSLLKLDINLEVSKGSETLVFKLIQGIIVIAVFIFSYILINPEIIGLSDASAGIMFALVMPLLSVVLFLVYYAERNLGPNVEDITYPEEKNG